MLTKKRFNFSKGIFLVETLNTGIQRYIELTTRRPKLSSKVQNNKWEELLENVD